MAVLSEKWILKRIFFDDSPISVIGHVFVTSLQGVCCVLYPFTVYQTGWEKTRIKHQYTTGEKRNIGE